MTINDQTHAAVANPFKTGRIDLATPTGLVKTYSIDIFDALTASGTYTDSALSGASYSTNGAGVGLAYWSADQVNLIADLLYNGANLAQNLLNTTGLQLAIWEVEYGTKINNAYDITSTASNFYVSNLVGNANATAAAFNAQTFLDNVTMGAWTTPGGYRAESLSGPGLQSLVYLGQTINARSPQYVPEPASVALFGFGVAGLWSFARRRPC